MLHVVASTHSHHDSKFTLTLITTRLGPAASIRPVILSVDAVQFCQYTQIAVRPTIKHTSLPAPLSFRS